MKELNNELKTLKIKIKSQKELEIKEKIFQKWIWNKMEHENKKTQQWPKKTEEAKEKNI